MSILKFIYMKAFYESLGFAYATCTVTLGSHMATILGLTKRRVGAHLKGPLVAAGRMSVLQSTAETIGTLTHLDTQTPTLYLDYPQGRVKCPGALVYTTSNFVALQLNRSGVPWGNWGGGLATVSV